MANDQKTFIEPADYHALSAPFASTDEANKALAAFCDEVSQLRIKHKLPDVHMIFYVSIQYPDGPSETMTSAHFGNDLFAEAMTAWAFGHQTSQRQERLGKLLEGSAVTKPRSRR